ncbi:MAG: type II toxin-antitoxin system HicA family toxin [Candidatus Nealsonbacteria bacterium]|nr:type II toxin-antitoxin system HicA family toxin [Candidatus Nealsonbacteria bacterium]
MSPRLPLLSGRQVCTALCKAGFVEIPGRGKGSHVFVYRADPPTGITIPNHKEIGRGTLRAILRQAGLTVEDFMQLL